MTFQTIYMKLFNGFTGEFIMINKIIINSTYTNLSDRQDILTVVQINLRM